ncbi:hypothetical protein EDM76_06640 [bacterium]|nr:MAG: hypothetical protein EDM76_06640 [bacterium]
MNEDTTIETAAARVDTAESGERPLEPAIDAIDAAAETNRDLLERLRAALLAAEPLIEPWLLTGETAEEVEASFAAARDLVARIREAVRKESAPAVPAGAPGRASPRPQGAFAKIRAGLEER